MRMAELRYREIINVCTGHRLGYVCDAEFDMGTGKLLSLIVPGRCRFFGLFGREEDYVVPFECITRLGDDIILAEIPGDYKRSKCSRRPGF